MHNLHLIIVNAESAAEAEAEVRSNIESWGDENNWRSIGGIAGSNGDNIMNEDDGRWGLDHFNTEDGQVPPRGYFQAIKDWIYKQIPPLSEIEERVRTIGNGLSRFTANVENSHRFFLYTSYDNIRELQSLFYARKQLDNGDDFPDWNAYEYDRVGVTDMRQVSDDDDDKKSELPEFIVLLDMHS